MNMIWPVPYTGC